MDRPRWTAGKGMTGVVMATLLGLLGLAHSTPAAEFACAAGDVACLIAAIHTANANGEANTITLAAGTYTLTAVDNNTSGPTGLPSVTSSLTLRGAGAANTIIARAANVPRFRLGHVASRGRLTLEGLTLRGGLIESGIDRGEVGGLVNEGVLVLTWTMLTDNGGGGISNHGSLMLLNSTLARNYGAGIGGASGGGLSNNGVATIINTTFVDNRTSGRFGGAGGGIHNWGAGTLTLMNSTLTGNGGVPLEGDGGGLSNASGTTFILNSTLVRNHAYSGGGIDVFSGTVFLQNTLLALNTTRPEEPRSGPDCVGPVTSLGHNLIGDPSGCTIALLPSDRTGDPGVGDFTDPGMPGQGYVPLLSDSPALDAGDPAACPATDQLGQLRVIPCDIGAIEFAPVTLALGLHQTTFRAGQTLRVGLGMHNPGPPVTADAYLGVFLPDGVTVFFVTSLAPLDGVVTRLDADPRMFAPLATAVEFPPGLEAMMEDFFVYTVTGGEAPGAYTIFTLLTPPGVFEDGQVDAGDLLGLTLQPFTVSP